MFGCTREVQEGPPIIPFLIAVRSAPLLKYLVLHARNTQLVSVIPHHLVVGGLLANNRSTVPLNGGCTTITQSLDTGLQSIYTLSVMNRCVQTFVHTRHEIYMH